MPTSFASPKQRTVFFCADCGRESPKWDGRCPGCGAWGSYTEVSKFAKGHPVGGIPLVMDKPQTLTDAALTPVKRIPTGLCETDRVLGGGLVPGALVLVAGDPGIGKSTLLLQIGANLAGAGLSTLYASGEESAEQVGLRAQRLGIANSDMLFLQETSTEHLIARLEQEKPGALIVDSIQTLAPQEAPLGAGGVMQVRESTLQLLKWAKTSGVPVVLAGHVTKDGSIAGPKVLEHMVDVVLQLEGDSVSSNRVLRCSKNRFGATEELALYEMGVDGLSEVIDPSAVLVSQRRAGVPGSAVTVALGGTRPMLAEVQALTSPGVPGSPRRTATGVDAARMVMLATVLSRRAGLRLGNHDIMVNIPGALRIAEPSSDLAVAMAIASCTADMALDPSVVFLGEIGLNGEVRQVPHLERRLIEASRHGFNRALAPEGLSTEFCANIEVTPVVTVREAISAAICR